MFHVDERPALRPAGLEVFQVAEGVAGHIDTLHGQIVGHTPVGVKKNLGRFSDAGVGEIEGDIRQWA